MKTVYQVAKDDGGFYLMKYEITKFGISTAPTKNRWENKKEMLAAAKECKLKIVNETQFRKVLEQVML